MGFLVNRGRLGERLMNLGEFAADQGTHSGKGAPRIDKRKEHGLAFEVGQADCVAILIDERDVGDLFATQHLVRRGDANDALVGAICNGHMLEPIGIVGIDDDIGRDAVARLNVSNRPGIANCIIHRHSRHEAGHVIAIYRKHACGGILRQNLSGKRVMFHWLLTSAEK